MVVPNDELISYIKDYTQPGTWYNCQSRDGHASFLFDILKIPDVSESEFDRWRKGSKRVGFIRRVRTFACGNYYARVLPTKQSLF